MNFTCESKILARALNKCAMVARPNSTTPHTRYIHIEAIENDLGGLLKLTATDAMTVWITFTISDATVKKAGSVLVDAKSIATFVSVRAATINAYVTKADRVMVKSGANKISLRQNNQRLPDAPELPEAPMLTVDASKLESILSISFMADQHDPISALGGTALMADDDRLSAMAMSRGRFGYAWTSTQFIGKECFLLPQFTTRILPHLLYGDEDVQLFLDDSKIWFVTNGFTLVSVSVEGNLPWDKAVEEAKRERGYNLKVSTIELETALKACLVMSEDTKDNMEKRVDFKADPEFSLLDISTSEKNEIGHMNWKAAIKKSDGGPFSVSIFADYAKDILAAMEKTSKTTLMSELFGETNTTIGLYHKDKSGRVYIEIDGLNAIFGLAPMRVDVGENEETGA